MVSNFSDLYAALESRGICSRMVAAWAVDSHTIEACAKAVGKGFVKVTLVGDASIVEKSCREAGVDISLFDIVDVRDELESVIRSVELIREGKGDVLMKGLCSTDKFIRAILDKEKGLLPKGELLCHI